MDNNGTLPYLKDIADSLKKAARTAGGTTKASGEISLGNLDTEGVSDVLEQGLIGTVEEEQEGQTVEVEKSQFQILADDLTELLHKAMFMTVGSSQTETSVFAYMHDRLSWLATLGISDIIQHLSLQVVDEGLATEHLELVSDIAFRSLYNVTAGAVGGGTSPEFPTVLEDWDDYVPGSGDGNTEDWVPSAKIVYEDRVYFRQQISDLWTAVGSGGGGGGGTMTIGLTMPPGFSVNNPVQDPDMTIAVTMASGYVIPRAEDLAPLDYFEPIMDNDSIVGIKSIHDLYIIQTPGDDTTTPPTAEVTKNISEILRHESLVAAVAADPVLETPAVPAYLLFDLGIVSSGNITAGAVSTNPELSNQILYRLDSWDDYGDGTLGTDDTRDFVPSAEIVKVVLDDHEERIKTLELEGGGGGSNVSWGEETTTSIELEIEGSSPVNLAKAGAFLTAAEFAAVFQVTQNEVAVVPASGQSVRNFSVPGNIVASGNVTAGAVSANSELSNQILYRLDSWDDYVAGSGDGNTEDWVPAAALVYAMRAQMPSGSALTELQQAVTALQGDVNDLENADAALDTRIGTLERRNKFVFVLPSQSYPADAEMEEGTLYVKLSQTSS